MFQLSVIIPFRCESAATERLLQRLEGLLSTIPPGLPIEWMVVDSGSAHEYREKCRLLCEQFGATYLFQDTVGKMFSIGSARDFGVQFAQGAAVSFLDVDLRFSQDFWQRVLVLMNSWGISKIKKSFLAIPCLYLTEEGTSEFLERKNDNEFVDLYVDYLQGFDDKIESMALCSSLMIVDRNHYLSVGGHDPVFSGHGYEDFELYHRLLCEEDLIPKPRAYYTDSKNWSRHTYFGFRSQLTVIARPALMMGLYVVHLWHPRPKTTSFYSTKAVKNNRTIWVERFERFTNTGTHPTPLTNLRNQKDVVVFFGKDGSDSSNCLRDAFPHLGSIIFLSEYDYLTEEGVFLAEAFERTLADFKVSKILFPNPYGNTARLDIYNYCRNNNIQYWCFERGALSNSWFFDPNGFNADSGSYDEIVWNKPLSSSQMSQVESYIQYELHDADLLEKQGNKITKEALANELNLGGKKVLFVPMQRPSDTVIKYMAGDSGGFDAFVDAIDSLANELRKKGWVVLCKKHPLETEFKTLKYARYVPDDTNIISLLELADRVALINSGVGLYAMMLEKPCYIFGNAFYSIDGVNYKVPSINLENKQEISVLADTIVKGFEVDKHKMMAFVHYLVHDFYSFGRVKTKQREEKDGSFRTITTAIDFYKLRINNETIFEYSEFVKPRLKLYAPIFERFALDISQHHQKAKNSNEREFLGMNKGPNTSILSKRTRSEAMVAKFAKLKKDPHLFFTDSKKPVLRVFRHFFRAK